MNLEVVKPITCFIVTMKNFIKPPLSSLFNCQNIAGEWFVTRLRLHLSYLRENKIKHG